MGDSDKKSSFLPVLGTISLSLMVGLTIGFCVTRDLWKSFAVKHGHAIYRIVDEYGNTEFEWLPPCNMEKKP